MNTPETVSTDWLNEAKQATEFFYCLIQDIETAIQDYYPGATIRIIVRDVLLNNPRPGNYQHFYETPWGQEFIITPTGATDTDPNYTNSKLYISFNSNTKKTNL